MKKVYKILESDSGDLAYMVSDGDNVVAWFADQDHAQEFANIRNGNYYAVRGLVLKVISHDLDRIKENVDRIFGER